MILSDVILKIEKSIPKQQNQNDNATNLVYGIPKLEINGILVCYNISDSTIEEALDKKLNLIVCFDSNLLGKSLTEGNYIQQTVIKAIENKIAIYVLDTNCNYDFLGLDNEICRRLGLSEMKILQPQKNLKQLTVLIPKEYSENLKASLFSAGAGNIGFYDQCSFTISGDGTFRPTKGSTPFSGQQSVRTNVIENMISVIFEEHKQKKILLAMKSAHPYEEVGYQIFNLENENQYSGLGMYGELEEEWQEKDFLKLVKEKLNLQSIQYSRTNNKKIKRVGVFLNYGNKEIKSVLKKKCDAYLTTDIRYHDYLAAESNLLICNIDLFEVERWTVERVFQILSQNLTTISICKTHSNLFFTL